ncbi:MAG: class I SAM-dependent methyltransferase [Cypionkella sp.]
MLTTLFERRLRDLVLVGSLAVTLPDGKTLHFGPGKEPAVEVTLHDPTLVRRLLHAPDLALGEAYMDGTLTIAGDNLPGLMALLQQNAANGRADRWRYRMSRARRLKGWFDQLNSERRARQNVAHHYDLSGALYDLFLDADRQYSCAYFKHPDDTLEQAQAQKKTHIAAKLLIEPGMRVLDIGCGWGGMALTLAKDYGAKVLGVTLSEEQHRVATERAAQAGLSDRVTFALMDYRAVAGQFDRIVSVGMFEHVGQPQYDTYFRQIRERLTPDGIALVHTICQASPPRVTSPWIAKYIFPGGYAPSLSEVMPAIQDNGLWTCDIEVWRLHYAYTLRHWRQRFEANIDAARDLFDERFCRMWRYYLTASEMSFRHDDQCVMQIQLARRRDAVPVTRDYLYTNQNTFPTQNADPEPQTLTS